MNRKTHNQPSQDCVLTCSGDLGGLAVGIVVHHCIYIITSLIYAFCSNALVGSVHKELQCSITCDSHAQPVSSPQLIQVDQTIELFCEAVGESVVQLV